MNDAIHVEGLIKKFDGKWEDTMKDEDLEMLEELGNDLGMDIEKFTSPEAMFTMHLINIAFGLIMVVIGVFLLFKTRQQKENSGKKIAGWILTGLGVVIMISHIIQIIN